ncbi:MAG: DUF4292 domain-containing protein [Muribaculaceae bacterium]|nr:DUF4292 domain-containing protein [Muribaculaceae bacterium]
MTPRHLHSRFILFITITLTLLASSCASHKGVSGRQNTPAVTGTPEQMARALAEEAVAWQTMSVPVSVRINDSGLPKLSGTLTMSRGKDMRLSLRFLGMEMGAMYITQDSIFGYAKPNRMYMAESIPRLLDGFPANVGNLQALMLGQFFTLGDSVPNLKGAEILPVGPDAYTINPAGGIDYGFGVSLPDNRIAAVAFTSGQRTAVVSYPTPGEVTVSVVTPGKELEAEISLNLDRAERDVPLTTRPFAIPSGYKLIRASSLLKALSKQ